MSEPSVSIVIPVFNGMPYLREAVASALAQTYEHLEVVVLDNASQDGGGAFLAEMTDSRLRVVSRDSTQTAADNWTQAVLESSGELVKLMCADDVIDTDAIRRQVLDIASHPGAVMAAARRRIIDADGRVLKARHGLGGLSGEVSGAQVLRACALAGTNLLGEPAAVLFAGDLLRAQMPWSAQWPYMIDLATYAKVLAHGTVVCDPAVLAAFRVTGTSWSSELLDEQPRQFRGWRDAAIAAGTVRLGRLDRLRSEAVLRARTVARRAYFRRAKRRAG